MTETTSSAAQTPAVSKIRQTPKQERPRERCLNFGASSLSLRECLAILIGSGPRGVGCMGLAEKIVKRAAVASYDTAADEDVFLSALLASDSLLFSDIGGKATQARLMAALEFAKRYARAKDQLTKTEPISDLSSLERQILSRIPEQWRFSSKEWLGFIPIYPNRKIGDLCIVEQGARTHVNLDTAEFFHKLLMLRPSIFYLCHNHPSGNLRASQHDLDLTKHIERLSEEFGIVLAGHWIVSGKEQQLI